MSLAESVFNQNNGDVTKAYYATMNGKGAAGELAVALFRAQKRSTAAKRYRGRKVTRAAYDVKNWSLGEVCRILTEMCHHDAGFPWGWKPDHKTPAYPWILYVDLPTGQCSFHSKTRMNGPYYEGIWRPGDGSANAIIRYCDSVYDPTYTGEPPTAEEIEYARMGTTFTEEFTEHLARD